MGRIAKKISRESIDSALQIFSQMPQKAEANSLPLNDAFLSLKPAISEMQKKGYVLSEILDILKDSGIDIGLTTLKSAVGKPRKKRLSQAKYQSKEEEKQALGMQPKPIQNKASAVQDPDEK